MADVITELRRPSTLGAVIFALVGWLLLLWSFAASNSGQDALRAQIGDAQKRNSQLSDELKRERDAAGSLADIAAKHDALDSELRRNQGEAQQAAHARDEAQGQLIGLADRLKATQGQQTEVDRVLKDATAQRDKALGELDTARQQNETVKQAFARASEQLAQKNSEVAALNGKVQDLQAAAAQQTAAQADAAKRLSQTQDAVTALLAQQDGVSRAVSEAQARLAATRAELDNLTAQVADRAKSLATPSEPPPQP